MSDSCSTRCETKGYGGSTTCSLPARRNLLGGVTAVLMLEDTAAGPQYDQGSPIPVHRDWGAPLAPAMARCIARRLAAAGRLVVAAPTGASATVLASSLELDPGLIIHQGEGDRGQRIDRVWRQVGITAPVAFFGVWSPDVPDFALARIPAELRRVDAAIGPTHHGGYWTLAARRYRPWLVHQIDWARSSVYDATCRRAAEADVDLAVLPLWPSIERLSDLDALRSRLAAAGQPGIAGHGAASAASLDALRELGDLLTRSPTP